MLNAPTKLRDVGHVVIARQPFSGSPGVYPAQAFVSLADLQGETFLTSQQKRHSADPASQTLHRQRDNEAEGNSPHTPQHVVSCDGNPDGNNGNRPTWGNAMPEKHTVRH